MKEQDLVRRLQDRDETAMEEFLRRFTPLMGYIIAPILPGAHDREECISETAMAVQFQNI